MLPYHYHTMHIPSLNFDNAPQDYHTLPPISNSPRQLSFFTQAFKHASYYSIINNKIKIYGYGKTNNNNY